ncbi:MAG: hypothetical protein PHP95_01125 [Desulfuromonadaceae bacterium]|nr:hypothetical protein [Desulfuromonadaceae bacterium]MDD2847034.1 hypothetical protein [Desulfuromonadaceae bacterium]MDD4128988.1 hypothetical protein [Desulfuromonadaceae bacterium]
MGSISDQVKAELRLLPRMLGKLFGATMAIIGFTMSILIITRKMNASFMDTLPTLFLGAAGMIVFVLFSKKSGTQLSEVKAEALLPGDSKRLNMVSWGLLLLLVLVFLVCTWLMTR